MKRSAKHLIEEAVKKPWEPNLDPNKVYDQAPTDWGDSPDGPPPEDPYRRLNPMGRGRLDPNKKLADAIKDFRAYDSDTIVKKLKQQGIDTDVRAVDRVLNRGDHRSPFGRPTTRGPGNQQSPFGI